MATKLSIRKDPIEELTEHICDNLCRYPVSDMTQKELDERCSTCRQKYTQWLESEVTE